MADDFPADHEHQQQTYDEQWQEDIEQTIVTLGDIAFRTYNGNTPFRVLQGLVEHDARFTVDVDLHIALLA